MANFRRYSDHPAYGRDRDWSDRAADEVRSWFGDDDAERRRRRDERAGYGGRPRDGDRDDYGGYGTGWSGRFRYPHGTDAADEYYRAAREQRREFDRSSAISPGAERPNYYGRGPKDYRRSDDRIRDDVADRMTDDWMLDASDITVAVQDGEVTLSGTVESREQKRRAEDLTDRVSGVRDVNNRLRVLRARADHAHDIPGTSTTGKPA